MDELEVKRDRTTREITVCRHDGRDITQDEAIDAARQALGAEVDEWIYECAYTERFGPGIVVQFSK